jgi:hypothetical protein
MYRDAPEPRETHAAIRVTLPARLVERLNQEAEALASPIMSASRRRDMLVEQAIERGLERRAPAWRCNPLHDPCDPDD